MSRLFFGNFDCEYDWIQTYHGRLNAPSGAAGSEVLRPHSSPAARSASRASADLATAWLAIANREDVVLTPRPPSVASLSHLEQAGIELPRFTAFVEPLLPDPKISELVPWGWTDAAVGLAKRFDLSSPASASACSANVNSRKFRFDLELRLGIQIPGSSLIEMEQDFPVALRKLPDPEGEWILKANFGMSGREAIRGRGSAAGESQLQFLRTRLSTSGPLVLEPRLEAIGEAGIQFEISSTGAPQLIGAAEQIIRGGSWAGSRFTPGESVPPPWNAHLDVAREIASLVQQTGYRGPLGIDQMSYRDAQGKPRLRLLQDLNARLTMGRLTLGWRRRAPPGWCGSWLSLSVAQPPQQFHAAVSNLTRAFHGSGKVVVTSPVAGGGQIPWRGLVLVQADCDETRQELEVAVTQAKSSSGG